MNIKTFTYLLDGFIQENYEYYNKSYVISTNYLSFIQEFLDIPPEEIKNIQDLFGLEMLKMYKSFDKGNSYDFSFRGYFKLDNELFTFIGHFDNDFKIYNISKTKNLENKSAYDLTLELESLKEKYSIPADDLNFLKIYNK
jgi:hypothetical protein